VNITLHRLAIADRGKVLSLSIEYILAKISRYTELSEEEMGELYDHVDSLYNEMISKYLEALLEPGENREIVNNILQLTKTLLEKKERSIEEELTLIALLDILASDLYSKTALPK